MILSALSLWKKFDTSNPLEAEEWGAEERDGKRYSHLSYFGNAGLDGTVRIYARFARPADGEVRPAILLLPPAGKGLDIGLMDYFVNEGYAVLMPDYSGYVEGVSKEGEYTVYPPSLEYGNFEHARGLEDMEGISAEQTTWFEWAYVALYSIEYLKKREDVGLIGVVGIKTGGDIAWQIMLSPDVQCAVPINSIGWHSFAHIAKFGENVAHNLSDDVHRYIAAVEAQSYAPYVKCPVLMLCAVWENDIDCDRAYDTYSRLGAKYGNALAYSQFSGRCIGPHGLTDMDLFLAKNLKGREIYIPDTLSVNMQETKEGLEIQADCDREGILEETGIFYAEADVKTKAAFREWRLIYKADGRTVKNGKISCTIKPYAGAKAVFAYAYAKYINGFRVTSKIIAKRLSSPSQEVVKSRILFTGREVDSFGIAEYEDYSVGGIFLEQEAVPKMLKGYGGILGVYSPGGVKTYKISSPQYIPDENALLKVDAYSKTTQTLRVSVEVAVDSIAERYTCLVDVAGGGKWKRVVLRAADFKGERFGAPLTNFQEGSSLTFDCAGEEEEEFLITNVLWL